MTSRYPGTHPFDDSEQDRARFFGREDEAEQLYLRVLSVPLLVQFGRSGLGKTSLLQAGLFPRLREKAFLPVLVRLNVEDESLTAAVSRSLEKACAIAGVQYVPGDASGLWELLLTTSIWRGDMLLTPVLVFDQFEEVFTLRDAALREELASELGALITGKPPARVQRTSGRAAPQVKIVISLREDYLGELEEFSAAIPGLFHERLRLEPMSRKSATDAIVLPARLKKAPGGEPYSSPRFELDEDVLNEMIGSGVIEPFQLQLLSGHAEAVAKAKGGPEPVMLTANDFKGAQRFALVLKNFYRDTLQKITPRSQHKRAEILCEDELLDADGHRLMLHAGQIEKVGVRPESLKILCDERLIRSELRNDRTFYEISHDRVAESMLEARKSRLPKRVRNAIGLAAGITVVVIAVAILWKISVDRERKVTERLLAFLLGDQFLGQIRDTGRSSMMFAVREQVRGIEQTDKAPRELRALALSHAGDVEELLSDLPKAFGRHQRALELFEELGDRGGIARSHARLGDILSYQGRPSEALKEYGAAIREWRDIVAHPDSSADDCVDLATTIIETAWLHDAAGRTEIAQNATSEAITIVTNVLFGGPSLCGDKRRGFAPYPHPGAINVLSSAARVRTQNPDSLEDAEGAAALAARASALTPYSIGRRKAAIVALSNRGHRQPTAQQRFDDYSAGLAKFEELWRLDPDNRLSLRERAVTQLLLVDAIMACHEQGGCNPPRALADAESGALDSLAALRNLAAPDPTNALFHEDVGWALFTHARVLMAEGRNAEALSRAQEVERHYSLRKNRDPDDKAGILNLAGAIAFQANALVRLQRSAEAEQQLRRAIGIYEGLLKAHPDNPAYLDGFAQTRDIEQYLLRTRGDEAGAAKAASAAAALRERRNGFTNRARDAIAAIVRLDAQHFDAGQKLREKGDLQGALRELTTSQDFMRIYLLMRPAAAVSYDSLAGTYQAIADVHEATKSHEARLQALAAMMQASQIALWLAKEGETANVTSRLLHARQLLTASLYDLGEKKEAESLLVEHIIVTEQLMRTRPEPRTALQLGIAKCLLGRIRLETGQRGGEDLIRSGYIHLDTAAQTARDMKDAAAFAETARAWRRFFSDATNIR